MPKPNEQEVQETDQTENENQDDWGGFDPEDAIVKLASKHGYQPKNKHTGDKPWVAPDIFIENQWKINEATKNGKRNLELQLSQMSRKLDVITEQYENLTKREQAKVQADLETLKDEAIERGDKEEVRTVDAKIKELTKQTETAKDTAQTPPENSAWMERNGTWYKPLGKGADDEVVSVIDYAEELYDIYKNPESPAYIPSRTRMFTQIDKEVGEYVQLYHPELTEKYQFPGAKPLKVNGKAAPKEEEVVEDRRGKSISDVEGNASTRASAKGSVSYSSLNMQEKAVCDSTCNNTGMKREKWLADYSKALGN